ncbi:MAG: WD40 repeat domain-containing protein, partial [Rubripirellula sp.]
VELLGHRDVLYAAKFSPDESIVATAGYDREIILWDARSGEPIRSLEGHNGAIFDLAFSPSGEVLVSACADETVKVWNVATGRRLDTLSQPEGEVFAVAVTADGKHVLAGSADNRLRVWSLKSKQRPRINPIVATRFVDESPLVNFELARDGRSLVVLSEGGNLKLIRTGTWDQVATLEPLGENGSDLSLSPDGRELAISLMNGDVVTRTLPEIKTAESDTLRRLEPVYLDLGELTSLEEEKATESAKQNASLAATVRGTALVIPVPRGTAISGTIAEQGEADLYQWQTRKGEVWAIDADAISGSKMDPTVSIVDSQGKPVLRTRLQAIRDSYFTFRGKDSKQIGDFRLFNWQEMHLNDYLFAAGEVTRLWMYPRGPDSGYNVYPNEGNRWTYFGTSHATHALGEPAYIVRPLADGETPFANGLPVFDLFYENDDDPRRVAGKNSRLLFTAPDDGMYTVRISDTRDAGGDDFKYRLTIRPAMPSFKPSVTKPKSDLRRGSGREFLVRVDRIDGFDGPVTFDLPDLPPDVVSNFPLTVESGQRFAVGTLWVAESAKGWEGKVKPEVIARGSVEGRIVERRVGDLGELTLGDRPSAIPSIHPVDRMVAENEDWTLQVRRGETVAARVVLRRKEGFKNEVSFGKENSGRNTAHGVYVDNIGLNGLLVRQNENEREFNLTADPIARLGKRSFFLSGEVDGKVTTHPITIEVLP